VCARGRREKVGVLAGEASGERACEMGIWRQKEKSGALWLWRSGEAAGIEETRVAPGMHTREPGPS
jgi:hypothetical protein